MVKFVLAKEAPTDLRSGEIVIEMPKFLEEIQAASASNRRKYTSASHMRSIANLIAINYDPNFDVLRQVKAHDYEGIEFNSPEELSQVVLRMLRDSHPVIFERYIETKIKNRPFGTKVIHFVGPLESTAVFTRNGIEQLAEKDVDVHLGLKAKKIVGKPAVTKEEAASGQSEQ